MTFAMGGVPHAGPQQNMPLWKQDSFELKNNRCQKHLLTSPFFLKAGNKPLLCEGPSRHQGERYILITRGKQSQETENCVETDFV